MLLVGSITRDIGEDGHLGPQRSTCPAVRFGKESFRLAVTSLSRGRGRLCAGCGLPITRSASERRAIFLRALAPTKIYTETCRRFIRRRAFAIKLAVQMTEYHKRRLKSDHHPVDLPTVALAAVVVVLLITACVVRLVSH
jgi:hypothetical protein